MYTVAQVTAGLDETAEVKKPSRFKFALQFMRWGTPVILLSFLGYQLTKIGWTEIWHSKPTAWAFYVLLLLPFFVQPVADLLIYRNLWKVGKALQLSVFLRKRYLNAMVMDYSGEAYFYFWTRQTLNVQKNALLHAIKDSNILSAGAGLAMVWIMLLLLALTGGIRLPALFTDHFVVSVVIASLPLILCLILVIGGKKGHDAEPRADRFDLHHSYGAQHPRPRPAIRSVVVLRRAAVNDRMSLLRGPKAANLASSPATEQGSPVPRHRHRGGQLHDAVHRIRGGCAGNYDRLRRDSGICPGRRALALEQVRLLQKERRFRKGMTRRTGSATVSGMYSRCDTSPPATRGHD